MNILKVSISLCLLATSGLTLASQRSVNVWKSYFPDARCSSGNSCARNVPSDALEAALDKTSYFMPRALKFNYMFVADFTQHSTKKRGYLIEIKTGKVTSYLVSHGRNSGDNRGNTIRFSNRNGSNMSSKGLYRAAEQYYGKHGLSMRMDGLEHTNSKARSRAIVKHGASYVQPGMSRLGRSQGCPAVENRYIKGLVQKLKGGSAYYIHGN